MWPYILIIFITYILALIWEKNKCKNLLIPILIVLLISIFAGLRSENVGSDVKVYAKPMYLLMNGYGYDYTVAVLRIEKLFGIIAFLAISLFNNFNFLLTIIQLIITIFIVINISKRENEVSVSLYFLTFTTVFLGLNFNLMRQSIAIAISIWAFKFVREKNLKKYFLSIILSMGFHITAIIAFPIYIIYNNLKGKNGIVIKILIIILLILAILSFANIFSFFIDIGVLPSKYNVYLTQYYNDGWDIQIKLLILKIFIGAICFYIMNVDKDNKDINSCFLYLLILDFCLFMISGKILYADRISYYYSLPVYLYAIPRGKIVLKNKIVYEVFIILFLFFYFWFMFINLRTSEIIPYTSNILNIMK